MGRLKRNRRVNRRAAEGAAPGVNPWSYVRTVLLWARGMNAGRGFAPSRRCARRAIGSAIEHGPSRGEGLLFEPGVQGIDLGSFLNPLQFVQ